MVGDAGGVEHQVDAERRPQAGAAGSARKLSVKGPVALTTTRARASNRAPVSRVRERDAADAAAAIAQRGLGAHVVGDRGAGAAASRTFSSTRRASSVWQST